MGKKKAMGMLLAACYFGGRPGLLSEECNMFYFVSHVTSD